MTGDVVVRARHDPDPVCVRVVGEALEIADDVIGVRHEQLAVRLHEVVLGIDVPEDDPGHATILEECQRRGISLENQVSVNRTQMTDSGM